MPITTTTKKLVIKGTGRETIPLTTKWKGIPLVRNHSFLATIREIINFSAEIDVCRIGLIGSMHSGKSTLSQSIAHAIHKHADLEYKIKVLYKEDLLDFENTLLGLEPVNYIMIFDDVSFMGANANKKQIEMVKSAVTTIRHLDEGRDVKIIVMMNYHYSMGLDKYLRSADFKYITTVDSSENENLINMFGKKYQQKILDFKKYRHMAITKKYWLMKISKDGKPFKYDYRKPFIPVMFWNENSLRFIVSPTRHWQDPICSKCSEATTSGELESDVPIDKFCQETEEKFGKGTWLAAVKLNMYVEGMTVYNPNVITCLKYLNKCREKKLITLESIAAHYDLVPKITRLRKKLSGVVGDE
uniref:ORF10 n=1 Tax=Nitrosopumilaceae spindle-shaped virus TaxID=3065433 RepID=A0AAT9JFA8_9VIRU